MDFATNQDKEFAGVRVFLPKKWQYAITGTRFRPEQPTKQTNPRAKTMASNTDITNRQEQAMSPHRREVNAELLQTPGKLLLGNSSASVLVPVSKPVLHRARTGAHNVPRIRQAVHPCLEARNGAFRMETP